MVCKKQFKWILEKEYKNHKSLSFFFNFGKIIGDPLNYAGVPFMFLVDFQDKKN